jgi:drug/metabolite transporter (DMT)-like permease
VTLRELGLLAGFAVALPIGQVMFKWAALHQAGLDGPLVVKLLKNYPLMIAFVWYGLSALLWFYILTRLPLSSAYPVAIVGAALVPVLAHVFFGEPITWRLAAGYLLLLAGLALTQRA